MGYGSVHWRRAKVLSVAFLIYLDCKAVQKIGKCVSKSKKSELWKKAHERNAKRMLKLMIDLEGLWVKFGQYLSTLADVLPEAYISVLKQLQDSLPPRPLKEVCRTIETELGKTMGDMFKDFIKAPLATASIAQVHRATMSNGQEVVVKVRHEGIKDIILEDLKNVKSVVDWIAWAEPQFDFNPVIDEFCRETPKEFDFNLEAENARTVSNNLCHKVDNEDSTLYDRIDVLIPKVIQSTEKVLILEFMDGIRLNDHDALEAYGVDKQKLVEEITRAYAHQIYVDGFFNGDPHPGNFLVSKDPPHRPILLDFGLTKLISASMKQALAKMFLASAEGDHATLLSAFSEMGIRFREDLPNIAMHIATTYFCATEPAAEALEKIKAMTKKEKKKKNDKLKKKEGAKDNKYFNPVDAFPSDAVIFFRVLDVLRGVSSMLNVRIVYHDVIRPFAETALQGSITGKSASDLEWIYPTPVLSDAESKVRQLLIELGKEKILGIQICAYKDGKVVIDTAAGMLGRYDPRAVQPDSLFPLFSATKGVTAGMLHWLANEGKVKMEENVASIWPSFSINGKEQVKVHHVLNHTSGLHTAMSDITSLENPLSMCDWKECLDKISTSTPVVEPGSQQLYHFLSFGWLCGGIIEHASGKPFQEILEEAIVHPLNVEGELYIGIPPGVETRLATLSVDMEDLKKLSEALTSKQEDLPTNSQPTNISDLVKGLPILFNTLAIRRAIIPAANGHSSARALARYYAALASNGSIPPPHTTTTGPQLGSHTHIPQFPLSKTSKNSKSRNETENTQKPLISKAESMFKNPNSKSRKEIENTQKPLISKAERLFRNPKIHDAFMGVGDYEALAVPNGNFGLGFERLRSSSGLMTGFGHSGIGGSTGFCDVEHNFAMAVTVNRLSLGGVTRSVVQLVCSELGIPLPEEFSASVTSGLGMLQGCGPNSCNS